MDIDINALEPEGLDIVTRRIMADAAGSRDDLTQAQRDERRAQEARRFTVTEADAWDGTRGICLHCGELADGVEPDARRYRCECCSRSEVYGLEEAIIAGFVDIDDDEADELAEL